jgi:hypothetical protein
MLKRMLRNPNYSGGQKRDKRIAADNHVIEML